MNRRLLFLVLPLILLAMFLTPTNMIPTAHAPPAGTGVVCLNDAANVVVGTNPCPATPFGFAGPQPSTLQPGRTQVRVGVYVNASLGFNAFDITLRTDSSVLKPAGADLTSTQLLGTATASPTVVLLCLGGFLVGGNVCSVNDTVDTLHVAAASAPGAPLTTAPTTGLLFTAIYNITGTSVPAGITIGFGTHCGSQTSVADGSCVTLANGSKVPSPVVLQGGTFNNSVAAPWVAESTTAFAVSATRGAAGPTVTITETAENGFPAGTGCGGLGCAIDSVSFSTDILPTKDPFGVPFTAPSFSVPSCATGGLSCTTIATFNTALAGEYRVTIYGTYVSDSGTFPITLRGSLTVKVDISDAAWLVNGLPFGQVQNVYMARTQGTPLFKLTAVSLGGYSGTITYAVAVSTIGNTAGLSMTTVQVPPVFFLPVGATINKFINATAPSNGVASVRVTMAAAGLANKLSPSTTHTIHVSGYTLSPNVTSIAILAGSLGAAEISSTSLGNPASAGFAGSVFLSSSATCNCGGALTAHFLQNNITLAAGGSGNANVTFTGTTAGTYTVTITGTGGTNLEMTNSTVLTVTIAPRTTTTSVTCATPVIVGSASKCNVTVTDTSPGPFITPVGLFALTTNATAGSFTFSGSCVLAGTTASAICSVTYTPSGSVPRHDQITASYPGDASHSISSGTSLISITPVPLRSTSTMASCSTPVVVNQGSMCTVTVTDTASGTFVTPSGTVSLSQTGVTGSFTACLLSGTAASATCMSTFTGSTVGTASVTANYPGDIAHSSSSGTASIVVNPRVTTTSVNCLSPVVINQGSACNVTVTDTSLGTAITPTGAVNLSQTGVTGSFTTCALSGTGAAATCSSTFTASTFGTASVSAVFPADTTHATSNGAASIAVNLRATTTTITCASPVVINQGSTCNVIVTDTSLGTAITPSGSVTLGQTGVTGSFTTCSLTGTAATATCSSTFTASTSGTAAVTATFPADTSHSTSNGPASISVNKRATATTVSCTSPDTVGQGSTCNVTVADTSPGTFVTPTGTFALTTNATAGSFTFSGSCVLTGTTASASCSVIYTPSGLAPRHDQITASYPGDTTHSTSSGSSIISVTSVPLRSTSTTVNCAATPVVINQGSTCDVTVTDTGSGTFVTPTGTVSLSQTGVTGSFTVCNLSGTTASATCTSTFTASTSGTASVTANYPGDTAHSSSSGTASITVNLRTTTTTVNCTSPVVISQGSTCNVTVADTSPGTFITPTGTVGLSQTGVTGTFSVCILSGTTASATCSSTFTASTSGTAAVTASYPGDTSHALSSGPTSIVVNKRATTTSIVCSSPVNIGQPSTCNVTVVDTSTGAFITPTGTFALSTNSTAGTFTFSGSCVLLGTTATATCSVTYTPTGPAPRHDQITAAYPGDNSHALSSSTSIISITTVPLRSTTTTVSCVTPVVVNQGSACDVTVSDTATGTFVTPSGTVNLSQTGVTGTFTGCTLGASITASATCTSTFTASTSGTAAVTANYPGDAAHSASQGTASIVVNLRTSTTTIVCASPVNVGQGSTCNVTVTDMSTAGTFLTPSGTVNLSQTGVTGSFTTCTLGGTTAAATCVSTFTASTSGSAAVTAIYPGDAAHSTSQGTTSIQVNPVGAAPTVTITSLSPNPAVINQVVTVNFSTTGSPTSVTIQWGDGTAVDSLAGTAATDTHTYSTTGTFTVKVNATNSVGTGTASMSESINKRSTTTALSCTTPVTVGQPSKCNVIVTDSSPGTFITPTGTVALSETGVTGSFTACTLSGSTIAATCSSTFTASTSGTASVTANYPGDMSHSFSSGATLIAVEDFAMSAVPSSITTLTGVAGTSTITVFGSPGLTVSLAADNVACTVSPGSVTGSGQASLSCTFASAQNATVTVTGTSGSLSHFVLVTYSILPQTSCGTGCSIGAEGATIANVTSNSTTIGFTATGQSGTTAGVRVTVPVSSVPSISALKVLINGTSTPFTFTTDGTSYFIVFTLTFHSSFVVQILLAPPTVQTVLLTFSAFDADDLVNGVGQLEVLVNGHIVIMIPSGTGTNDNSTFDNRWVKFGPFNIAAFINSSQVQQTIVFTDPQTADHFALIRNVTIVQGNTLLLQVLRARGVFPGHSVTYTFSVPPLVLTSFTASPANPIAGQAVTFTVTFTGGTPPFRCFFGFSDDDEFTVVSVTGQSCSAVHHFDMPGTFSVIIIVRGSSTSDLVASHLSITVSSNPAPAISLVAVQVADNDD